MRLGKYILTLTVLLVGLNLFAQTDTVQYGKLEVKVIDAKTKKPIEFALVTIKQEKDTFFNYSDSNGLVTFDNLVRNTYNIEIKVMPNVTVFKIITLNYYTICGPIFFKNPPLIKPDGPTQQNLNKNQIMRMPF
jgi:hypothetical protein